MSSNVLLTAKSSADRTQVIEVRIDPTTNALVTIDAEHNRIHAGRIFSLSGQLSLGAGVTSYFHGLTDSLDVHFRAAALVAAGAPMTIVLYEGATVTSNGTPMTPMNRKRSSVNTATLSVFSGPTVSVVGTPLEYGLIPEIGPAQRGGMADLFSSEWVLDLHNTSYLVSITNNDAGTRTVNYNFLWYEA